MNRYKRQKKKTMIKIQRLQLYINIWNRMIYGMIFSINFKSFFTIYFERNRIIISLIPQINKQNAKKIIS